MNNLVPKYTEIRNIIHIKGLNGIRAIAALLVVVSHTLLEHEYFGVKINSSGLDVAPFGVTMFFTLSGFLITYLLLKEKATFNDVNIRGFYIRRILRIWPLYYFYLAIVCFVVLTDKLSGSFYYYLFMGANIPAALNISLPLLAHYWSLGVEEQFYLFWPWLVKLFSPLRSISVFLIIFLAVKLTFRMFAPDSFIYQFFHITRFDCMAIGALSAILLNEKRRSFLEASFHPATQIISWCIILIAAFGYLRLPDFITHDVFSIASAMIILNVSSNDKPLIGLENRLLDFLGRISYGIYIYHVLVIYGLGKLIRLHLPPADVRLQIALIVIAIIAISVLISWLSYEYFEKRFLRLKDRFSRIHSRS